MVPRKAPAHQPLKTAAEKQYRSADGVLVATNVERYWEQFLNSIQSGKERPARYLDSFASDGAVPGRLRGALGEQYWVDR
jgi:hypothetical protein